MTSTPTSEREHSQWETALLEDHCDVSPPWWPTTLMSRSWRQKIVMGVHPNEGPPWWGHQHEITAMIDRPNERSPWCENTQMRKHLNERPCTWMRDYPAFLFLKQFSSCFPVKKKKKILFIFPCKMNCMWPKDHPSPETASASLDTYYIKTVYFTWWYSSIRTE